MVNMLDRRRRKIVCPIFFLCYFCSPFRSAATERDQFVVDVAFSHPGLLRRANIHTDRLVAPPPHSWKRWLRLCKIEFINWNVRVDKTRLRYSSRNLIPTSTTRTQDSVSQVLFLFSACAYPNTNRNQLQTRMLGIILCIPLGHQALSK